MGSKYGGVSADVGLAAQRHHRSIILGCGRGWWDTECRKRVRCMLLLNCLVPICA